MELNEMELNEIKKLLYREKPKARFERVDKDGVHYSLGLVFEHIEVPELKRAIPVFFLVPLSDIGDAQFLYEIPAQLLIRYIVTDSRYIGTDL